MEFIIFLLSLFLSILLVHYENKPVDKVQFKKIILFLKLDIVKASILVYQPTFYIIMKFASIVICKLIYKKNDNYLILDYFILACIIFLLSCGKDMIKNISICVYTNWNLRIIFHYVYYFVLFILMFRGVVYVYKLFDFDYSSYFSSLIVMQITVSSILVPILYFIRYLRKKKKCYHFDLIGLGFIIMLMNMIIILLTEIFDSFFIELNPTEIYYLIVIIVIITSLIISMSFPISSDNSDNHIKVEYLNLNIYDIIMSKFYSQENKFSTPNNGRFFKIDFSTFLPNEVKDCKIQISNHFNHAFLKEIVENENKYVYFYVEGVNNFKTIMLKFKLSYKLNGKEHKNILNTLFQFQRYEDEIVFVKSKVIYCCKYWFDPEYNYLQVMESKKFCALLNKLYQFDGLDLSTKLEEKQPKDIRKWMVHDGGFGSGKSTFDVLSLYYNNRMPVVISPWEENTNDDFLYLIFEHLNKETKIKMFFPTKSVLFFFLATFIAVGVLLTKILEYILSSLSNVNVIDNSFELARFANKIIISISNFNVIDNNLLYILLIWGVSLSISFIFTCTLLPTIVIHAKNSTLIHQSYYLKGIHKMLKKSKAILVIEDIDRFDNEKIEIIYRIASSINRVCYDLSKPVGLISYQIENVRDYNNKILGKLKNSDTSHLKQLQNKVVYTDYIEDYSEEASKNQYFKMCVKAILLYKCISYDMLNVNDLKDKNDKEMDDSLKMYFPKTINLINKFTMKNDNYRSVRNHLYMIYKLVDGLNLTYDEAIEKYIKSKVRRV